MVEDEGDRGGGRNDGVGWVRILVMGEREEEGTLFGGGEVGTGKAGSGTERRY